MNPAERPPVSAAEQIPFDVQVKEVNLALTDRVPTFEEFTAARTLADQMDFDKPSDTFTAPDGSFVDADQAKQLRHLTSESTWLLNDAQELALLKARGAVDDTLRQKATSWITLDRSIRAANKTDAQQHQEGLRQERVQLQQKKDQQRLESIKHDKLAPLAAERTEQLLWKTAFNNGGTRMHDRNPELRQWVHDKAEDQAIEDVLAQIAARPDGKSVLRKINAQSAAQLRREKIAKVSTKPHISAPIEAASPTEAVLSDKTHEASKRRALQLTLLRPYIARLLRADIEATEFRNRAASRAHSSIKPHRRRAVLS